MHISLGRKKYDNSTKFYKDYFGDRVDILVQAILEYKRIKSSHKKEELYLADLIDLK